MAELNAPAPIGELTQPTGEVGGDHPPIPAGLLSSARDGDANAVRLLADWFREEGFPHYAAWCAVLAEEMAIGAAFAFHIYRILTNRPKPKPVPRRRTTAANIRELFAFHSGLCAGMIDLIGPFEGVINEGGAQRTSFTFRVPRHHVGGFNDVESDEGFRVADAIIEYASAAFPRGRFEVEECCLLLSTFATAAYELLDLSIPRWSI